MASNNADGLQVIGAGLMRTGTTSLHLALEQLLGGKCYHMKSVLNNPSDISFWVNACKKDPTNDEWRQFFTDYKAAVDFPPVAFYRQLMEVYPNAKVILTIRDPQKWYVSVNNTIVQIIKRMTAFPINVLLYFSPRRHFATMLRMLFVKSFGSDISAVFDDEASMIDTFNKHVEEVKNIVPADRLLIFEATEGWAPLCEFLDVPQPTNPYPRANTSEEFGYNTTRNVNQMKTKVLKGLLAVSVVVVGIGVGLYYRAK